MSDASAKQQGVHHTKFGWATGWDPNKVSMYQDVSRYIAQLQCFLLF